MLKEPSALFSAAARPPGSLASSDRPAGWLGRSARSGGAPELRRSDCHELPRCHRRRFCRGLKPTFRVSLSASHSHFPLQAGEPIATVVLTLLFLPGEKVTLPIFLSLLPIVAGVAVSSMSDASFQLLGLAMAMGTAACS